MLLPTNQTPQNFSKPVRIFIWTIFWLVVFEAVFALAVNTIPPLRDAWQHVTLAPKLSPYPNSR